MAVAFSGKLVIGLLVVGLAFQRVQAQGTLLYETYIPGRLFAHVFGPEVSDPSLAKVGNTAAETPSGTQVYTGSGLEGSGWSAQLFAAPGAGQPEGSLTSVVTTITTFRTGAGRGIIVHLPISQEIPGIFAGETGTFQLRAWDNQGGTLASWLAAEPVWLNGSIAAGKSIRFDVQLYGGLQPPAEMLGFRSFNVHLIPEPSPFALASLGGAVLFICVRNRQRHRKER